MSRQLHPIVRIPAWRRGWTRYHLSVVVLFAALVLGAALRALLVIDSGGYETRVEVEVPFAAEAVWPLASDAPSRQAWRTGVTDILPINTREEQVGTKWFVWYVNGDLTWRGTETLTQWIPGRLFASYSDTERGERNFSIELEPLGPCRTRIIIKETVFLKIYRDRFFAFWEAREEDDKAERSAGYLAKRADTRLAACQP